MATYTIAEAERLLDELIDRALSGERVMIARDDHSMVELKVLPEALSAPPSNS